MIQAFDQKSVAVIRMLRQVVAAYDSSYMHAYSPDFNFYDPKSCVIDLLAHGHKTNG